MPTPFAEVVKLARKNPILVVGGVGAVGALAFIASRGSSSDVPPADDTGAQVDAQTDLLGTGGDTGPAAGYGSPYDMPPGGGYGYDPFGGAGVDPYGPPDTGGPGSTADGCSWPPPAIPAGYEGRGSWGCSDGSWVWHWIDSPPPDPGKPPGTTPKGCPLPKPTLPPRLIGQYKYECKAGKWALVRITGGTPPPVDPPPGHPPPGTKPPNVAKGQQVLFAGHRNAKNHLILGDRKIVTLPKAEHWNLGPAESGDRTPGTHGGEVRVRKVQGAHGHAGLVGMWLKV